MATTLARHGLQAGTAQATAAEPAPAEAFSPMHSGCPQQVQALLTAKPWVRALGASRDAHACIHMILFKQSAAGCPLGKPTGASSASWLAEQPPAWHPDRFEV